MLRLQTRPPRLQTNSCRSQRNLEGFVCDLHEFLWDQHETEKSFIDVAGIAAKLGIGHPDLP